MAGAFDQRLHRLWVEPVELRVPRSDDERRRERHEVEHALSADLQRQRHAMVGHAVAVQILAVEVLGDIAKLLPGLRHGEGIAVLLLELGLVPRLSEQVAAVVHDLAVVVVGDHVFLPRVFEQAARRGQHVCDVPLGKARVVVELVVGHDVVARHQVAEPPGAGKCRVVLAGAVGHIGDEVVEELAVRDLDDIELGAGGGLELVLQFMNRPRDHFAGEREHRHALAGKRAGAGLARWNHARRNELPGLDDAGVEARRFLGQRRHGDRARADERGADPTCESARPRCQDRSRTHVTTPSTRYTPASADRARDGS